jgi:hypothetical protein
LQALALHCPPPRRCTFLGPTGGRGRELLLNIMAPETISGRDVTRFRLRYSMVDRLLIAVLRVQPLPARATSLEVAGATLLPNKLVSIPIRSGLPPSLCLSTFGFSNCFTKGPWFFTGPLPQLQLHKKRPDWFRLGCLQGACCWRAPCAYGKLPCVNNGSISALVQHVLLQERCLT